MVVFLQFPFSRQARKYPPMLMMALGVFMYVIGFSMYGYVSTYSLFVLAMVIITLGEMVITPVSQSLIASFAPEDMRGRYMAVSGFAWGIPFAVGPYIAGLILDGPKPYLLWYIAGAVGTLSMFCFLALHRVRSKQTQNNNTVESLPEVAAL
jgi:MFS family permease